LPNGLEAAKRKIGDVEKKNVNEVDFDEAKTRRVTLSRWAAECKNAMRERDASLLAHLERAFGSTPLAKITEMDIIDYRAKEGVKSAVGFLLLTGKRWWIFARCSRGAVVGVVLPQHHRLHSDSGQIFCPGNCSGTGRVGSSTMRRSPSSDFAESGTAGNGLARRTA